MRYLAALAGGALVLAVITDVFHTIVLARRTRRSFRITRAFYKITWALVKRIARRIESSHRREALLGTYAPLSLLSLIALWAAGLVTGFAAVRWSAERIAFTSALYRSATTFFTLETGSPVTSLAKIVTVLEGGLGFTMLGLVISYLPVMYQSFSRRELEISMLDARAGSPPSACGLLRLNVHNPGRIEHYLEDAEQWAAEILENQLSFPMMAWYRSQHANQSWLTAMTAMIDAAAVISLCAEGDLKLQAEFTFAMIRHVIVDLAGIFELKHLNERGRLTADDFVELRRCLGDGAAPFQAERLSEEELRKLIQMYEPQAAALSRFLLMSLPPWKHRGGRRENWKVRHGQAENEDFVVSDPYFED